MRMRFRFRAALILSAALVGCGPMPVPVAMGGPDGWGRPPEENLGPFARPGTPTGGTLGSRGLVDQICRTQAMPTGWIAIAYMDEGDKCPRTDEANRYNAMTIERYAGKPVGSVMYVCADQGVPRHWIRDGSPPGSGECPGARVGEGRPTMLAIRRIR